MKAVIAEHSFSIEGKSGSRQRVRLKMYRPVQLADHARSEAVLEAENGKVIQTFRSMGEDTFQALTLLLSLIGRITPIELDELGKVSEPDRIALARLVLINPSEPV